MDIVLALVFGVTIGMTAHFVMAGRDTRGAALLPLTGTVLAGAAWLCLTWLGFTNTDLVLWAGTFIVPTVAVFPLAALLTRKRRHSDEQERARLNIA